jgi:peptidoglycan/LPS O-acetylase OafA/YrhL
MGRRLQRLYPAFLVSVVLGVIIDFWRPIPKIPGDFTNAVTYLAENLLFLPGLLPLDAVSAPNWSLSYEWWFYTTATLLFSVLGLARLRPTARISIILAFAAVLLGLSANNVPNVPVRGLCLLAGMLLAEAKAAKLPPLSGGLGVGLGFSAFIAYNWVLPPVWIGALLLAFGFSLVCCVAVDNRSIFSTWLTWPAAALRQYVLFLLPRAWLRCGPSCENCRQIGRRTRSRLVLLGHYGADLRTELGCRRGVVFNC